MTTQPRTFKLPTDLEARLVARAAEMQQEPESLLEAAVNQGLDLPQLGWLDGGGSLMLEAVHSPNVLGVYYRATQDEEGDGYADDKAREQERAEFEQLLRQHGIDAQVVVRDYEVGRGAQGDPATVLQIVTAVATVTTLVVAALPAGINQWRALAPAIRSWLHGRRGEVGVTLALVKSWCLEDARGRVENPDEIVSNFVQGHRGSAFTSSMDIEGVGPYCVTVQVPERSATFVYVTDELGQILQFVEVPGPTTGNLSPEDNDS